MNIEISSKIKEQYEKHEKFVRTLFLFFQKRKPVLKEKNRKEERMAKKRIKNLGGEKKKK